MAADDYYWSEGLIKGFGKMWFLLAPQEASGGGGAQSLLGSVVEELSGGWLGLGRKFPAPYHMTTPGLVLNAIDARRGALGLAGAQLVESATLAGPTQNYKVDRKGSLKAGAGPFPSLPANLNLDIDYSRMRNITISFGDSSTAHYIPTDYLARLYRSEQGDLKKLFPSVVIPIDDNYIVDEILLARDFTVTFDSDSKFDDEFTAKLEALKSVAPANISISVSGSSQSSVVARIKGEKDYLVALKVIDWDDLG